MKRTLLLFGTMGLLATACGGEAPQTQASVVSASAEAYDVDVEGTGGTLYARVQRDGRTAYALQDAAGTWREGYVLLVDADGNLVPVGDPTLGAIVGSRIYDALTQSGPALATERQAFTYLCAGGDKDGSDACDRSEFDPLLAFAAEPHKPLDAEPHRDGAEPHDDADAEPHKKPEAEPHEPVVAAEPH